MKICSSCREMKEINCFSRRAKNSEDRHTMCIECNKAYNRTWRKNKYKNEKDYRNRKIDEARRFRIDNPEKYREVNRISNEKYRRTKEGIIYYLHNSACQRAKISGLSFNITREFISLLFDLQKWKCKQSGIQFVNIVGNGRHPFAPSIDRINSDFGYEPYNIQIVCVIYNLCKNKWDDKTVIEFARLLVEHKKDEECANV